MKDYYEKIEVNKNAPKEESQRITQNKTKREKKQKPIAVGTFGAMKSLFKDVFKKREKIDFKNAKREDIMAGIITIVIIILLGIILWIIPATRGFIRSLIPF